MKNLLTIIIILSYLTTRSQPTYDQRTDDTVIGWWYKSTIDKPQPFQYKGRDFSLKQQENMNTIIEWMKKTYTPVGGVGTFKRMIYADDYSNPPHSYGIDFRIWNVHLSKQWIDEKGFCKPVSEEYTKFYVAANIIPGGYPISFVNTPAQYLFAWAMDGYAEGEQAYRKRVNNNADPRIHPNAYKYITCISYMNNVILAPGNKLPITAVTMDEYLRLVDEAIDRDKQYPDRHTRMHESVKKLREKYKNTLNEQAILEHSQPDILDYESSSDPFEIQNNTRIFKHYYPVYKYDASLLEKCKTDKPQWIVIGFPYETVEDGNQLYEMYKSLTENFNYEYVYNYFFDPEKVKGLAYKPVAEAERDARLEAYRKRAFWKDPNAGKSLAANVVFNDDFSSNADGAKAAGWYASSKGKLCFVTSVKGLPGKWVQLGYYNRFSPNTSLQKPLPKNFRLEFDVATDEFNSRTGGALEVDLTSYPLTIEGKENFQVNGSSIKLRLVSGNEADYNNNNYRGEAIVSIRSNPEVNNQNNSGGINAQYDLREFTNRKNSVHVALESNNDEVTLKINNKTVITPKDFKMTYGNGCVRCGLPEGTIMRNLQFNNVTTDWGVEGKSDGVDVYISNVKISKL